MIPLLLVLVVVGVILAVIPMDQTIRNIVIAIIALAVLFWCLSFFGVLNAGGHAFSNFGFRHR